MRILVCCALAVLGFMSAFACVSPEPAADAEATVEAEPSPATSSTLSPSDELTQIKTRLEAVKTQLFDDGEYNCCVEPSCHWCALHEGSCDCFANLQAGDAVCPGCGLGWHDGEGIVDGVAAGDVEWNITHEHPAGGHEH